MNTKGRQNYKKMIRRYFEEFRGYYSVDQTFRILLGVSTIIWANMKEGDIEYNNLLFDRILNESGNGYLLFQDEIERLERGCYRFDGSLRGIFDKIIFYENKSGKEDLKNIFGVIKREMFSSVDDVRRFINELVKIGNQKLGINDTPESIIDIITGLIDLNNIRSFANYCSGSSIFAVEMFEKLRVNGIYQNVYYYGEEKGQENYMISKILMVVNEVENYETVNKDPLEYKVDYNQIGFDLAVCDIPQKWRLTRDISLNDPRFRYNKSTRSSEDWAFIQNVLYHLNSNGKGVVVGTKGTLVRSTEDYIRRAIIEEDLIECVITLPDNLYEKSNIGTEIIIFNKFKNSDRRNKVLFINASKYDDRLNKTQHTISSEGIAKILECYRIGFEEERFSKFINLEKMQEYSYRLNPIEYLEFDVLKNSLTNSVSLGEIAQVSSGVQISKKDMEKLSEEPTHYYLNIKDINEGKINYEEDSMLTFKKLDWLGKYDIQPQDILLTTKGWAIKAAVVDEDFKPSFISGNLTRIRIDQDKYNPYILYEYLQSEMGTKMMEGLQTGTTIKLLNNSQLERLEVPIFKSGFMNEIGDEIKINKIEYERKMEEATRTFEKKREHLVNSLGWRINKNK